MKLSFSMSCSSVTTKKKKNLNNNRNTAYADNMVDQSHNAMGCRSLNHVFLLYGLSMQATCTAVERYRNMYKDDLFGQCAVRVRFLLMRHAGCLQEAEFGWKIFASLLSQVMLFNYKPRISLPLAPNDLPMLHCVSELNRKSIRTFFNAIPPYCFPPVF